MSGKESQPAEPLLEPLTTREEEILALLTQQHSAAEIAHELTLAVSTVKWYVQQLYGKLGVNSKRQALARARELGLVAGAATAPDAPTPPPKPARTDNLPVQVTRFFGRENEIAQLKQRLAEHRLITLTGSGGVGKTRLSLQVASAVRAEFADGVWLVELAPLTDPALVPKHVAQALGVSENPDQSVLDSLTLFLSDRQLLLVLDNCEHLLEACAQLVETLLRGAARLKILASSREPLNIAGEAVYGVRSLPFPNPVHLPPLDTLSEYAAVRLFVDRARLVMPDYQASARNAAALARICQRLDGIPLAIELAASRVNVLSAERLAERLDDSFRVLTGGTRTALPRQQTLRATIDWSYELLTPAERRLLERLAVFAGGCTLEAAEVICADGAEAGPEPAAPTIGEVEVLELLAGLVRKSMVTADRRTGEETRYTLLETVRQYAREKLHASGEGERLRARHLEYFLQLALEAGPELKGPEQLKWLDRLAADLENLRAALEYSLTSPANEDAEAGLRLAVALEWFWEAHAHWPEVKLWLEAMLAQHRVPERSLVRADALRVAAHLRWPPEHGRAQAEESVAIYREAGAAGRHGLAYALIVLGDVLHRQGRFAPRVGLLEESAQLFREVEDNWGLARALHGLAATRDPLVNYEPGGEDGSPAPLPELKPAARNDHTAECALFEASLAMFRALGDRSHQSWSLESLGHTYFCLGQHAAGRAMLEERLQILREFGDRSGPPWCLAQLGRNALAQDELEQATRLLEEAQAASQAIGWDLGAGPGTPRFYLAEIGRRRGEYASARRLLEESLSDSRETGNGDLIALELDGLGRVDRSQGDHAAAGARHMEALRLRRRAGHPIYLAHSFHALALLAAEREDQTERAARLFGAAQPYDAALYGFWSPLPIWRAEHERAVAKVRARLGDEAADRLWAEGEAMTLAQAYAYALES
jgi:predicted ATPase/DNA-binding CsgD family transcriptional regulator